MMLPEAYSTFVIEDGGEESRELTWAEIFPSVFDPNAEFKPRFEPLGNEQGSWRIDIGWAHGEWDGPRPAKVIVNTVDPEEEDIDVILDHQTVMYVWGGGGARHFAWPIRWPAILSQANFCPPNSPHRMSPVSLSTVSRGSRLNPRGTMWRRLHDARPLSPAAQRCAVHLPGDGSALQRHDQAHGARRT